MSQLLPLENVKELKDRLRELKDEWISSKPGRGRSTTKYIDKDTVVQILEYATHGITTWDFEIIEQWREEVYKNFAQKGQSPQWGFDGYVYHVKGRLYIEGLGSRMQFGKKVAEGGANNQDSAYQAAASTCLSKCASLFGVGEKLYVKNQIQNKEEFYENTMKEFDPQGYQDMMNQGGNQQNPYAVPNGGTVYQNDQMNQQQNWNQNNQQNWNQQQYQPDNNQQQNFANQQPANGGMNVSTNGTDNMNWNQNNQQQNFGNQQQQNNGSFNGNNDQTQNPWANTNLGQEAQNVNWQQTMQQVDQELATGKVDYPFENVNANQAPATEQANNFQVQEQGQVKEQNFQAQTMGAPIMNDQAQQAQQQTAVAVEEPKGSDQQQLFMEQVTAYNQHRARLGIQNDDGMLAYLRDYFQNEKADTSFLNMETIKGFNEYMKTIQA